MILRRIIFKKNIHFGFNSVKNIMLGMLVAIGLCSVAYGQSTTNKQIIVDPAAPIQFQPQLDNSANGTSVINIPTPSSGGLSHSKFKKYNVDTSGVILNNSGTSGASILGGNVAGNPNIRNGRAARVILNEVTGSSKSNLLGPTEVFGNKADVIVANPNGIECVGCTFINSGRVTLSTGVPIPNYTTGNVKFSTTQGQISISGSGLSAPDGQMLDAVDLIGRTIEFDGVVKAQGDVRIRSGASEFDQATNISNPIVSAPALGAGVNSISTTTNGVIHSGQLSILASDVDLKVKLDGHLSALTGNLEIISAGDLSLKSTLANHDSIITAAGNIVFSADQQASGKISITGNSLSGGTRAGLTASDNIILDITKKITTNNTLKSGKNIVVKAEDYDLNGLMIAADAIDLDVSRSFKSTSSTISSKTIDIVAGGAILDQTWVISTGGTSIAARDVTLGSETRFQIPETAKIDILADNTLKIDTLINTTEYNNLSLNYKNLHILKDGVFYSPEIDLDITGDLVNEGRVIGENLFKIKAVNLINKNTGTIYSIEINLELSENIENHGQLIADNDILNVSAGNVYNKNSGEISSKFGNIKAKKSIINDGIFSISDLAFFDTELFVNSGKVASNVVAIGADLNISNFPQAFNPVKEYVLSSIVLNNNSKLSAKRLLKLDTGVINISDNAIFESKQDLSLALNSQSWSGSLNVAGNLILKVNGDITANSIVAGNNILLEASKDIFNTKDGKIIAGSDINIKARNLTNNQALIHSDGKLIIDISNVLKNQSATIEANNNLTINAYSIINEALEGTNGGNEVLDQIIMNRSIQISMHIANLESLTGSGLISYYEGGSQYGGGYYTGARDQYDTIEGSVNKNKSSVIRSGANLTIQANELKNIESKLLSVSNINLDVNNILNDNKFYNLDVFRHISETRAFNRSYGGNRTVYAVRNFHAPAHWDNYDYNEAYFTPEALASGLYGEGSIFSSGAGNIELFKGYGHRKVPPEQLSHNHGFKVFKNKNLTRILNLERMGIDPDNIPEFIYFGSNIAKSLDGQPYVEERRSFKVGTEQIANPSLINAGGNIAIDGNLNNKGSVFGQTVVIDGATLNNGVDNFVTNVRFTLDDVKVTNVDANQLGSIKFATPRSADLNDFGVLPQSYGQLNAASLIRATGQNISGSLGFYNNSGAEATALANAAILQTGNRILVDDAGTITEQRSLLYKNAYDFIKKTNARIGVRLTPAQRAALDKPIIWFEKVLKNGQYVLTPKLYNPSQDNLLRVVRGTGHIRAKNLDANIKHTLTNRGTILIEETAAFKAGSILNEQRYLSSAWNSKEVLDESSGLISAGKLSIITDGDLDNRGSLLSSSDLTIKTGGDFINRSQSFKRIIDKYDGCKGRACGKQEGISYTNANIMAGGNLSIISDKKIKNYGAKIGAVENVALVAGEDIIIETLQDSYVNVDIKKRGFLSSLKQIENKIVSSRAEVQSLGGNLTIVAGGRVNDDGTLAYLNEATDTPRNLTINGGRISALQDVVLSSTGDVKFSHVTTEVHNEFKTSGFSGLSWSKVKKNWNEFQTDTTDISGNNVIIEAANNVNGIATNIAAREDILINAVKGDIQFSAHQNQKYYREKGFSIGLTFPGSEIVDAVLKGDEDAALAALAQSNSFTGALYRISKADNGVAAGFAVVDGITSIAALSKTVTQGALGTAAQGSSQIPSLGKSLADQFNPFSGLTNSDGSFNAGSLGIQISTWKKQQKWTESYRSELHAGQDAVLKAATDINLLQGTRLFAQNDATLDAGRDIKLTALKDVMRDKSSNFGLGISIDLSFNFNYGKSKGFDETLTNAGVEAGNQLSTKSGRDTNLISANLIGNEVDITAGRDLNIVTTQAKGKRSGFSVGFSIGPGTIGFSGSREKGKKAWSSASTIEGREGVDIEVEDTTRLIGAMINSQDGEVNLSTGQLEKADLHDVDKYSNIGGGITVSLNPSKISQVIKSLNFNYQKRDKQGITRATIGKGVLEIRDQNGNGVEFEVEDQREAEAIVASINRDPEAFQIITKDKNVNISGSLNVQNLVEFKDNVIATQNAIRALNAELPASISAKGPNAELIVRRMIGNGKSIDEALEAAERPEFNEAVRLKDNLDHLIAAKGLGNIPSSVIQSVINGETILYSPPGFEGQYVKAFNCGSTNGSTCYIPLPPGHEIDGKATGYDVDALRAKIDQINDIAMKNVLKQIAYQCIVNNAFKTHNFTEVQSWRVKYGEQEFFTYLSKTGVSYSAYHATELLHEYKLSGTSDERKSEIQEELISLGDGLLRAHKSRYSYKHDGKINERRLHTLRSIFNNLDDYSDAEIYENLQGAIHYDHDRIQNEVVDRDTVFKIGRQLTNQDSIIKDANDRLRDSISRGADPDTIRINRIALKRALAKRVEIENRVATLGAERAKIFWNIVDTVDIATTFGNPIKAASIVAITLGKKTLKKVTRYEAVNIAKANGVKIKQLLDNGDLFIKDGNIYVNKLLKGFDAPNRGAIVDDGKFEYLFGRVASGTHNTARSLQIKNELARVGIHDNTGGRKAIIEHLNGVISDTTNITGTFTKTIDGQVLNFETRQSLFSGPGGFLQFNSTFRVNADGTRSLTTIIPKRGN